MNLCWEDYIISMVCRKMFKNPLKFMEKQFDEFNEYLKNLFELELDQFNTFALWGAGHQALFTLSKTRLRNFINYIVI